MITAEDIIRLATNGESYKVDLKASVPSKVRELAEEVCSFANADGGYILIGIDNQNNIKGTAIDNNKRSAIQDTINSISPSISCESYSVNVDGKNVWVIEVPRGKDRPYIYGGSVYVRQGANAQVLRTRDEMMAFFRECNSIHFDEKPTKFVDMEEELDKENFSLFCEKANISESVGEKQILTNLEAFDKESGLPKAGAVMFFCEHPEKHYAQSWVHCVRFLGKTRVNILDNKHFKGTLHSQYTQALNWLKERLETRIIINDGGPHKEVLELPEDALREALINALCHRDYYEDGAVTMVEVYDDRVVITNPGGLLPEVAEDFGHKSLSRNPFICAMFTRMQLVEKIGSGIKRMRDLMRENNLPEPIFDNKKFFNITFMRGMRNENGNGENIGENFDENKYLGVLTDRQCVILREIYRDESSTATSLARTLAMAQRTVEREISYLRKNGYIDKIGPQNKGRWIILK